MMKNIIKEYKETVSTMKPIQQSSIMKNRVPLKIIERRGYQIQDIVDRNNLDTNNCNSAIIKHQLQYH